MSEKIFISPQIGPATTGVGPQPVKVPVQGSSFESLFQKELEGQTEVKFSAHALKRLESRQIALNDKDMNLIKDAINRAEAKGAKESLILLDNLALVVSIKNRTVITAVDEGSMKDNVFTNIDSAVIARQ